MRLRELTIFIRIPQYKHFGACHCPCSLNVINSYALFFAKE
ncbi:MAG TPA: hypothetical protein VIG32_01015 [Candidatus Baltobacteraceae bacterium]